MLEIYGFPSQAFWRSFEIDLLKTVPYARPILEVGCSDGEFTRQFCGFVETAIDINPRALEVAKRSGVFGEVRLQDAATLDEKPEFQTVLFNSVIEHIPDAQTVLEGCYRALLPGGQIILTVPLIDMNRHLLFSSPRYIRMRRRRLSHVSLFAMEQWEAMLAASGFRIVRTQRYLAPEQIKLWDKMDVATMLGTRRFNLGTLGFKIRRMAPKFLLRAVDSRIVNWLGKRLGPSARPNGCAALIVAVKSVAVKSVAAKSVAAESIAVESEPAREASERISCTS